MKKCRLCNRVFEDNALTVCPDDGGPLINDGAARDYAGLGGKATWSASQDEIPELQRYLGSSASATKPRRMWPWVVPVVAVLVIILVVIVLAVIILSVQKP